MPRTDHNPGAILLKLLGLALAAAVAVGLQASERASSHADLYGYSVSGGRMGGACGFDYIDLATDGTDVALVHGHARAAEDDRAGVVPLARPFEFYQAPARALVVSENGYIAVADSLKAEDGSDFSNDCSLPARPDNSRASPNRIYVYHDDLRPRAGSSVRQAHFQACPRPAANGAHEPCTVVEWNGYERTGPIPSSQPLRAQAVLYHDSHEIALQYDSVDDSGAAQATIGLQGFDGRTARQASCNTSGRIAAREAVCFQDPRRPASGGGSALPSRQ